MVRRRKSAGGVRTIAVVAILAVLGAGAWYLLAHHKLDWVRMTMTSPSSSTPVSTPAPDAIVAASSARVDAANEGRRIRVEGELHVEKPARDADLGVQADALVLVRSVQMRQWREACSASGCDYALAWSDKPIDSHAFRIGAGHANTAPFPFSSQRFTAGEVRVGAFAVEPVAALAQGTAAPYAVDLSRLPPNLAASFRAQEGELVTGDPAHPAQGDLRVAYSIIPAGPRTLVGVQRGSRLVIDR